PWPRPRVVAHGGRQLRRGLAHRRDQDVVPGLHFGRRDVVPPLVVRLVHQPADRQGPAVLSIGETVLAELVGETGQQDVPPRRHPRGCPRRVTFGAERGAGVGPV